MVAESEGFGVPWAGLQPSGRYERELPVAGNPINPELYRASRPHHRALYGKSYKSLQQPGSPKHAKVAAPVS